MSLRITDAQLTQYQELGWRISQSRTEVTHEGTIEHISLVDGNSTCQKVTQVCAYVLSAPAAFIGWLMPATLEIPGEYAGANVGRNIMHVTIERSRTETVIAVEPMLERQARTLGRSND